MRYNCSTWNQCSVRSVGCLKPSSQLIWASMHVIHFKDSYCIVCQIVRRLLDPFVTSEKNEMENRGFVQRQWQKWLSVIRVHQHPRNKRQYNLVSTTKLVTWIVPLRKRLCRPWWWAVITREVLPGKVRESCLLDNSAQKQWVWKSEQRGGYAIGSWREPMGAQLIKVCCSALRELSDPLLATADFNVNWMLVDFPLFCFQ